MARNTRWSEIHEEAARRDPFETKVAVEREAFLAEGLRGGSGYRKPAEALS